MYSVLVALTGRWSSRTNLHVAKATSAPLHRTFQNCLQFAGTRVRRFCAIGAMSGFSRRLTAPGDLCQPEAIRHVGERMRVHLPYFKNFAASLVTTDHPVHCLLPFASSLPPGLSLTHSSSTRVAPSRPCPLHACFLETTYTTTIKAHGQSSTASRF